MVKTLPNDSRLSSVQTEKALRTGPMVVDQVFTESKERLESSSSPRINIVNFKELVKDVNDAISGDDDEKTETAVNKLTMALRERRSNLYTKLRSDLSDEQRVKYEQEHNLIEERLRILGKKRIRYESPISLPRESPAIKKARTSPTTIHTIHDSAVPMSGTSSSSSTSSSSFFRGGKYNKTKKHNKRKKSKKLKKQKKIRKSKKIIKNKKHRKSKKIKSFTTIL